MEKITFKSFLMAGLMSLLLMSVFPSCGKSEAKGSEDPDLANTEKQEEIRNKLATFQDEIDQINIDTNRLDEQIAEINDGVQMNGLIMVDKLATAAEKAEAQGKIDAANAKLKSATDKKQELEKKKQQLEQEIQKQQESLTGSE